MDEQSRVPSAEQLDVWIAQNKRNERGSKLRLILIALAFAISVGAAVSNVLVLQKLDERGQRNRELIMKIDKGVENTQKLLDFTDRMDSPEQRAVNEARTQALLDELVGRVGCDTRFALLDAIGDVFGPDAASDYERKITALCAPTGGG